MIKYDIEKREADQKGSRKGKDYMFTVDCLSKSYNEQFSYALLQYSEQGDNIVRSYEIGKRQNTVIDEKVLPK